MPEKSAQREPSTPSTRNRARRLEDILEEREKLGSSQTLENVTRKSGKPGSCAARNRGNAKRIGGERLLEEKGKCEVRSKRFFPTHKQQSSRSYRKVSEHSGAQRSNVSPECCFGKWRRQTRSCIGHKTAGNNTRKLKRDVLGRRRPLYIFGKCGLCQPKYKKIRILVVKTKSFCTKKENKSSGNPIAVQKYPDETKLRELQEKVEDATKYLAIDMQEGLYLVSRYEKSPSGGRKNDSLPPAAWR